MSETNNNETQVRLIIERWAKAVREKDMEGILAYHSENIIMFDVPEPFQSIGIDAYRQTWDLFFKYTRPDVFDIETLQVIAGEDVAFGIATMKCWDNSDGKGFIPLSFRLTVGLQKIHDRWMIVHEHHSIPAE